MGVSLLALSKAIYYIWNQRAVEVVSRAWSINFPGFFLAAAAKFEKFPSNGTGI